MLDSSGGYAEETSFIIYIGEDVKISAGGSSYGDGDIILTLEAICDQPEYVDGICVKCGDSCIHRFTGSVCTVCGFVCQEHTWDKGTCTDCGAGCAHPGYSNGFCSDCGSYQMPELDLGEDAALYQLIILLRRSGFVDIAAVGTGKGAGFSNPIVQIIIPPNMSCIFGQIGGFIAMMWLPDNEGLGERGCKNF